MNKETNEEGGEKRKNGSNHPIHIVVTMAVSTAITVVCRREWEGWAKKEVADQTENRNEKDSECTVNGIW